MQYRTLLCALLLAVSSTSLQAGQAMPKETPLERYYFAGKLDEKYSIQMDLRHNTDGMSGEGTWSGEYFYLNPKSTGERILLTGMVDAGGRFQLSEYTESDGKRTISGSFSGSLSADRSQARGNWTGADGKRRLPFSLARIAIYRELSTGKRMEVEIEGELGCPCFDPIDQSSDRCTCEATSNAVYPALGGPRGDALRSLLENEGLLSISPNKGAAAGDEESERQNWEIDISIAHYAPPLLALEADSDLYPWGAAHGMQGVSGLNLVEEGANWRKLELKEVIDASPGCIGRVNAAIKESLRKLDAPAVTEPESWQADLNDLHTRDFLIQPGALTFLFSPYDMGPYAMGTLRANVPYRLIADCIPPDSPISALDTAPGENRKGTR